MLNLYDKFNLLNRSIKDTQYPISTEGAIKAYYGISNEGFFRISFLSTSSVGIKGTTKAISIVDGATSNGNYWTCFDLKNDDLLSVFCSFGEDMISCIEKESNETMAASKLRFRFNTWVALFRKTRTPLSEEKAKGLFGELYFMKTTLIDRYGYPKTISSWSGPEQYSKDYAIDDTWYEIKTVAVGSAVAKISSLQQLSSDVDGHLVVIRVEEMAPTYNGSDSSINNLLQSIISSIEDNETKDLFLDKISNYGYDFSDDLGNKKYAVKRVEKYRVDASFPVLRERDIKSNAVNNVSYELILKLIKDWLEE